MAAVFDKTETRPAWNYDDNGKYTYPSTLTWMDRSPISGTWQIPAKCTTKEVLPEKEGFDIYFNKEKDEWEYVAIPEPEPEPEKPLEEVKQEKIFDLKMKRDMEEVSLIEYNGHKFDYDDKARERMLIARTSLADNRVESISWTTADTPEQNVNMTVADFAAINSLAAQRSNNLHIKYRGLKAQVEAAETKEAVEAIKWNA
jgi:hypothetical protein